MMTDVIDHKQLTWFVIDWLLLREQRGVSLPIVVQHMHIPSFTDPLIEKSVNQLNINT